MEAELPQHGLGVEELRGVYEDCHFYYKLSGESIKEIEILKNKALKGN